MENEIVENVQDEAVSSQEEKRSRGKNDVIVELALFFILGFLLGVTLKTEAVKKITIGFNDYKLEKSGQGYDVQRMEKALLQQAANQQTNGAAPGQPATGVQNQ